MHLQLKRLKSIVQFTQQPIDWEYDIYNCLQVQVVSKFRSLTSVTLISFRRFMPKGLTGSKARLVAIRTTISIYLSTFRRNMKRIQPIARKDRENTMEGVKLLIHYTIWQ